MEKTQLERGFMRKRGRSASVREGGSLERKGSFENLVQRLRLFVLDRNAHHYSDVYVELFFLAKNYQGISP